MCSSDEIYNHNVDYNYYDGLPWPGFSLKRKAVSACDFPFDCLQDICQDFQRHQRWDIDQLHSLVSAGTLFWNCIIWLGYVDEVYWTTTWIF